MGPPLSEGADERDPDFDTGAERVFEVVAVELAEGRIVIEKEAQLEALLLVRAEKDIDTLAVGVDDRLAEADAAAVLLCAFDARAAADGVPALSPVMEGVAPLTENELHWDVEGSAEGVGASERDGARETLGEPDSVNEGVVVCPSEPDAGALEGERRGELDSDALAVSLALDLPELLAETAGVGERDNRPLADALGLRLLTPTSQPTMVPLNHVGAKPGVAVPTPLVHVALLLGDADAETQGEDVRVALREPDTAGVRESVSGALSEGDGRGVREGCNEALAAALSVREVESVRVGLLVTASPVRVTLTHAVAVVETLTDTLTRAERDEEGDPVSEKLLVSHTLRVMLRVCVRVPRGDAESEDARLGEGLDVGEADADRQRLPVAEDSGERDASGVPEKEPDTDAERDARDAVAIAVRVPPHKFGPRSGGRGAPPAGRGAPVARGENVAVAKAGAEGAAGSVGAGASVGTGSSEKLTTSQKVAGAFAVKVPSGVLERDAFTDAVYEPDTEGVRLAAGERLSRDCELNGVAELERLPLPEAEGDAYSEMQFDAVGLALELRLTLREPKGDVEADAEPAAPLPLVTVRVPLAGAVGDTLAELLSEVGAESVCDAVVTSVKVSERVGCNEAVPLGQALTATESVS